MATKTTCDRCGTVIREKSHGLTIGAFRKEVRPVYPDYTVTSMHGLQYPLRSDTVYVPATGPLPAELDLCESCHATVVTDLLPAFLRGLGEAK